MGARGPKPGQRFGGRQKGTPNKDKKALLDLVEKHVRLHCVDPISGKPIKEYHPVLAMATIAHDPTVPVKIRAEMHAKVAEHTTPKLKSVEIKNEDDSSFVVEVVRFSE